jgi:serine protease DegQ
MQPAAHIAGCIRRLPTMRKTWLFFAQTVTVAVAVLFVVATLKPGWLPQRDSSVAGAAPTTALPAAVLAPPVQPLTVIGGSAPTSYSAAARRASPSVVSITASRAPPRSARTDDPMYRFFFGDRSRQAQEERQVGLGSGVIVSTAGYLLTNNHVVEGADDIEVSLNDGRTAKARVIGTDPESDVAVLKIELDRLPAIGFGNPDTAQVGDVVLAIGNPFGVGQTVTSGIISALGRSQLGINTFENFIQTDAAINPGNSGGALVDASGNLLGINTAIYSRSGGSLGIGFAIPISTAHQVMDSLIKEGRVTRGWIGVEPRDLTPEIAHTLNLPIKQGVLITGVLQNGPASEGGIKPGDVVVKIAGAQVANTPQLLSAVAALKPRSQAAIGVQRGDKALDLTVTVAQRPAARAQPQPER